MDAYSGRVLSEHNADKQLPPASLTKLMTFYVLFTQLKKGEFKLSDSVVISDQAWRVNGARMFIRAGTTVKAETLLRGSIVHSANDATIALAEHATGSVPTFVEKMNEYAKIFGLENTHFVNATGLHRNNHYSSARDLSIIAARLVKQHPKLYKKFAIRTFRYKNITHYNHNALLWQKLRTPGGRINADGIKTGSTRSAGRCITASAKLEQMRLIVTILGTKNETQRTTYAKTLLQYGFKYYETRLLYAANTPATRVRVWMGNNTELPLGMDKDIYVTLPRGKFDKLQARLTVKDLQVAPILKKQKVGHLVLEYGGQKIAEHPLLALKRIDRGNMVQRTFDKVRLWFE